jgi:hypothetical protein
MFSFRQDGKWGCGLMVTFTVTDTEDDGGWTIVAVPENHAELQFLPKHSPSSELGYLKLVLRHALKAAQDAGHPTIVARRGGSG